MINLRDISIPAKERNHLSSSQQWAMLTGGVGACPTAGRSVQDGAVPTESSSQVTDDGSSDRLACGQSSGHSSAWQVGL